MGCHALLHWDLPSGIEPTSLMSPVLAGGFFLPLAPLGKALPSWQQKINNWGQDPSQIGQLTFLSTVSGRGTSGTMRVS